MKAIDTRINNYAPKGIVTFTFDGEEVNSKLEYGEFDDLDSFILRFEKGSERLIIYINEDDINERKSDLKPFYELSDIETDNITEDGDLRLHIEYK